MGRGATRSADPRLPLEEATSGPQIDRVAYDELLKAAQVARRCRADIRALIPLLPAQHDALEALIDRLNEERVARPFSAVVLAALADGRRVSARHLTQGAALFEDAIELAGAALHMEGNVAEALLLAIDSGRLDPEQQGIALLVAAAWCAQDPERKPPASLLRTARTQARHSAHDPYEHAVFRTIHHYLPDEGLGRLLEELGRPPTDHIETVIKQAVVDEWLVDPLGGLPERPPAAVQSGYTVRRAVPKLGRNDPCHCGSGRKYKQCCLKQDQERLQRSSEVAGLTVDELEEDPNRYLTLERIETMRAPELERVRSEFVPGHLRADLVERLLLFREGDAALAHLEAWETTEAPPGRWGFWLYQLTRLQRADLIRRLLAVAPPEYQLETDLLIETRLLLLEGDIPAEMELLEQRTRELIDRPAPEDVALTGVAYALLEGRYPALGILVARGLAPLASRLDAIGLTEAVLKARDKLDLQPLDPIDDILDRFDSSAPPFDDFEDDMIETTLMAIEAKGSEMDELKRRLAEAQHELERQERLRTRSDPAARPTVGRSESTAEAPKTAAAPDLRQRLEALKTELKSRHAERNQLRRELEQARQEIAELRSEPEAAPGDDTRFDQVEQEHVLREETFNPQPIRLVAFPAGFQQRLARYPRPVARLALSLSGRLAAGEPAAFVGALRLKSDRELLRQRVGKDYRLLFRLTPDLVQIVDLVDRKDFERRLKSLV